LPTATDDLISIGAPSHHQTAPIANAVTTKDASAEPIAEGSRISDMDCH